jgi:cell division protein ZipA
VIDVAAGPDRVLKRSSILGVFTPEWLEKNGRPTMYGRATTDKKWTYVYSDGAPDDYDQLALAADLTPLLGKPREAGLNDIARAAEAAAKRLGASSPKARLPVKDAIDRARQLDALHREFEDAQAVVVLAAPDGKFFDGRTIWDVMMSLGLHWGDMDEFHWENASDRWGDDHLFSVSSTTQPGYFIPEEIAAGHLKVRDLYFDFSIPRSPDPKAVLEGMLAAATYARKRLGGELVLTDGASLDSDLLRMRVADIAARLTKAGFAPGHDATMRLF